MTLWLTIIGTSAVLFWIATTADPNKLFIIIDAIWSDADVALKVPTNSPSIPPRDREPINKISNQGVDRVEKVVGPCLSRESNNIASKILERMDFNVHPCDNFYNFACGGFINSTTIPADKVVVDTFDIVEELVNVQLKIIMDAKIKLNEPKPFRLVKKLYQTCMDQTTIEAQGLKPLRKILDEHGGWPVLDGNKWNETDFDWRNLTYKFCNAGLPINYFSSFQVSADPKNNTKAVIDLGEAELGLDRVFLIEGFENNYVQSYYAYMVEVAVLMGAKRADAEIELKKSLLFEIELAKITLPAEEQRDSNKFYNPMTVKKLMENYPRIPWRDYLTRLLSLSEIDLHDEMIVIVNVPDYIEKLENLISNTASKRIQANYAMWRVAQDYAYFLNAEIRKKMLAYESVLTGQTEDMERWKVCINVVRDDLGLSVSSMYVRKYFNATMRKNAAEMITRIQEECKKSLEEVEWLDETTKQAAREKASEIDIIVAYRDELMDDEKLDDYYKNLEFSNESYLESMLKISLFKRNYEFGSLKKSFDRHDWTVYEHSALVNAFYFPALNSIEIPAGILQDEFFKADRPKYMNYGSIGSIISHEIIHAFDDEGRQYDKYGNLKEWWTNSTREKFNERANCIVQQYGNYTVDAVGLKLNGINTQGENIADNVGIKTAYHAYANWASENLREKSLPGLDYTPKQMFWISVANTWCTKYRPEVLKILIHSDTHSPPEFRIIGPLSNMKEFLTDFECPPDSRMARGQKCIV